MWPLSSDIRPHKGINVDILFASLSAFHVSIGPTGPVTSVYVRDVSPVPHPVDYHSS